MASSLRAMPFVQLVLTDFMRSSGLEPRLLGEQYLRITDARPGRVHFELDIMKQHTNRLNTVHGGTIASMVDLGGSLAVASMGYYTTGVSTDINVTYIQRGGKAGDTIKAVANCDKMGRTLAFTNISFFDAEGNLTARGSHTKHVEAARSLQGVAYQAPFRPFMGEGAGMAPSFPGTGPGTGTGPALRADHPGNNGRDG